MSTLVVVLIIFLVAIVIFFFAPKDYPQIKVGSKAPSFSLLDESGNKRSLHEFKGSRVVLYFYPMDDTPGCTKQACGLRDTYPLLKKNNVIVVGVNYQAPGVHKAFKEKQGLPFILLSDAEKIVAKKYGAHTSILNNLYPERKTFLIDETGHIVKISGSSRCVNPR